MDKNYIRQYGKLETTNWWFTIRQKIILQTLQKFISTDKISRLKILNVGVAAGASSKWLAQLGDVVSVENEPLFIEYLHAHNYSVTQASIISLPFENNSFDIVCAFDVIEHVDEDDIAVKELWRVCKTGGAICITVPAFQSLWGTHDIVNGHKRRYRKAQLQSLVTEKENGKIIYASYFNSILFIPIFIFRKITALFKSNTPDQSDFSYFTANGFSNKVLKMIFGIEPFLLRFIKFPLGVSLLLLAQKKTVPVSEEQ